MKMTATAAANPFNFIAGLAILVMCRTVSASLSFQTNMITCFESENSCVSNCSHNCYYLDNCNGSSQSMYACVSHTILIIVASVTGALVLLLIISCVLCCFCPCCCVAQCLKRKRERDLERSSDSGYRGVMSVQQINPNDLESFPNGASKRAS